MKKLALIIGFLLFALPAAAEQPPQKQAQTPGPATIQGIVEDLTGQLGRLIGDLPRRQMDCAVAIATDLPRSANNGADLTELIHSLLLGAISRSEPLRSVRGYSGEGWSEAARARSMAASEGFELLVWLELTIEANHLVVAGMVYETERHLWRDATEPERQVLGQLHSRTRVNAEVRHYLQPLSRGPLTINKVPLGGQRYLALAVADLDGDGLAELALLGRRQLEIRRLAKGQAPLMTKLKLAGMLKAITPSRDPVGTLVIGPPADDGARSLALRTSDYRQGMVVSFDGAELSLDATITDFPIHWAQKLECTTITPGRSTFQTAAMPCGSLAETAMVAPFFSTVSEGAPQPDGPPATSSATALENGTIVLNWNEKVAGRVFRYGTALAMSDVDDDGTAEVLLSSDRDPGTGDELTVLRLGGDGIIGSPEHVGDVSGSVWVASSGDVDDDGLRELLAISQAKRGAQLLIIEPTADSR